jgi:type I restriction enzyme M protein
MAARLEKAKAADNGPGRELTQKLWQAADKLRSNMDAAEYKHVVLGLIFLKYISDAFEAKHAELEAERAQGADPEDPDEYRAFNIFWVPKEARWRSLQASAKQPTIGKLVDEAMVAIERDNPPLKGVLPKDYNRPGLDKQRLGELIDLIGTIGLGDPENKARDLLGRVYEYFLAQFASAEGKKGGQSTPRARSCNCWSRCSPRTRAAYSTPAAARAACSCRAKSSSCTIRARSATSRSTARNPTTPPGACAS